MMTLREQLIAVSDAFCAARGLSRSRVSTIVLSSGMALDRIASGSSDLATRKFEHAMRWFSDNWPESVAWPENIDRPPKAEPSAEKQDGSPPPTSEEAA